MKRKLFRSIFLTTLSVMVLAVIIILPVLYRQMTAEKHRMLRQEAQTIAIRLADETEDRAFLQKAGKINDARITWIDADGKVLYDSYARASTMENHRNRPEVKAAKAKGHGSATRVSSTLSESTYYYALRLDDGSVLRLADTGMNMLGLFGSSASIIAFLLIVVVIGAFVVSNMESEHLLRPINHLDLDHPLDNEAYDELSPLLVRLDRQHRQIDKQMAEMAERQQEFEAITGTMSEGLIVIDHTGHILSINEAATRHGNPDCLNLSYLTFSRDPDYLASIQAGLNGRREERITVAHGRSYRLLASPVSVADGHYGVALFISDVTDQRAAEQQRRDFTANVSHELKTPLTAIMGYAEIIGNGIAKPEDTPAFAQKIIRESQRLLGLIGDIIRLAQLDEMAVDEATEPVELHALAVQVQKDLSEKAAAQEVTLETRGEAVRVRGLNTTLYEMLYNLVDNAITYNRRGGSAVIETRRDGDEALVSVADTGIGIAEADQARIFERFYRVDKSRSKATGGTGLGLSIVKHGAMVHRARVEVTSTLGEGSRFVIHFPVDNTLEEQA